MRIGGGVESSKGLFNNWCNCVVCVDDIEFVVWIGFFIGWFDDVILKIDDVGIVCYINIDMVCICDGGCWCCY